MWFFFSLKNILPKKNRKLDNETVKKKKEKKDGFTCVFYDFMIFYL